MFILVRKGLISAAVFLPPLSLHPLLRIAEKLYRKVQNADLSRGEKKKKNTYCRTALLLIRVWFVFLSL